jgi:hypothetical protein
VSRAVITKTKNLAATREQLENLAQITGN